MKLMISVVLMAVCLAQINALPAYQGFPYFDYRHGYGQLDIDVGNGGGGGDGGKGGVVGGAGGAGGHGGKFDFGAYGPYAAQLPYPVGKVFPDYIPRSYKPVKPRFDYLDIDIGNGGEGGDGGVGGLVGGAGGAGGDGGKFAGLPIPAPVFPVYSSFPVPLPYPVDKAYPEYIPKTFKRPVYSRLGGHIDIGIGNGGEGGDGGYGGVIGGAGGAGGHGGQFHFGGAYQPFPVYRPLPAYFPRRYRPTKHRGGKAFVDIDIGNGGQGGQGGKGGKVGGAGGGGGDGGTFVGLPAPIYPLGFKPDYLPGFKVPDYKLPY